jgi:serine/threonine protein kinase/tetratricopeptide (TPR) repeat protein
MTKPAGELAEALQDRYAFERELGRGGMATVYLARDLRHDRPVAFKLLHPELAATMGPERFQREIRLAARLQHPHILTVLDSGETSGRLWFTMPYVQGESLRDRLDREKQLPIDDALRIAREAADALDYAHQQGIIHRDIKPENILLTSRHALVADFGIARALDAGGGQSLTETGMAVGTPAYMSPEQASGQRELDGRTDIYSLGVVLYEMLAGEPPFGGATPQAMIARRLTETARPLRTVRETIAEPVERAVAKALAKAPADRFATAGDFARALEIAATAPSAPTTEPVSTRPVGSERTVVTGGSSRPQRRMPVLALTLVLGIFIGLGVLFAWRHSRNEIRAGASTGRKVIAVLPFQNLGDSSTEYFADGITDAVRGKLSTVPGLEVIASQSSNEYKRSPKSLTQIARELDADYLLLARVRWASAPDGSRRVEVSPELVEAVAGRPPTTRWQQPFDAAVTDVFQVQGDIASKVASALDVALGAEQKQALAEKPTADPAAYDAYLKGEAMSLRVGTSDPLRLRQAIGFFEQAVAIDSGFAQAWAQLSRASSLLYFNGTPSPELARRAKGGADRALSLTPNRSEGQIALGDYFNNVGRDFPRALQAYEAGLRISPNSADLLGATALAEISTGRWEDALAHLTRAQAIDPRSIAVGRRLAYTYLRLRRYPESIAACDRTLALDSSNVQVIENKVMVYIAQGDLEGARRVLGEATRGLDPTATVTFFGNFYDLYWILPPDQQALLLRLTPSAFADRAAWAIVLAQTYYQQGNIARTRAYADSARIAFEGRLRDTPDDPQSLVFDALALAYLGRKSAAIAEGEKALTLQSIALDAYNGPYTQHQLVRIYLAVGEPEKALDRLEPLLKVPYYLSPGWLKVDPNFDPLRKNPRFQKLVQPS